jgi:uncharacterized protein (DUF885 family)
MRRVLLGLLMLVATGPVRAGAEDRPAPGMDQRVRIWAADEDSLRRFHHMPMAAAPLLRLERFAEERLGRLERLDFDALDQDGRVDYVLLRNHLERVRNACARRRGLDTAIGDLVPFASALVALEAARRRLEVVPPREAAAMLQAATSRLATVRDALGRPDERRRWTPVLAYRAARAVDGLRSMLTDWFRFRDGYEPEFAWWLRTPFRELDDALKAYAAWLKKELAGIKDEQSAPLIGDPIGRDALVEALGHEFLPYTPEQLLRVAETEIAWCEREGARCARALGSEDWKGVVEKVKAMHVPPGEQDDLVASQAREIIQFLEARELVTVPAICAETWRIEMISQHGQKTLPFAVYDNQRMRVAYATEGMGHEAKLMSMRGNNEHFTRIVTPHELIPGHHLQLFVAARERPHRQRFRTPFLVEGWALHWEMLLWDLGWARDERDQVGMLFWRMHRCARIIVTLGFHLGEMKPEAMVDFLVDRVGLERDGATSEVRRYVAGAYGPLYQCAYMLGGLQMRALHRELVGGKRMSQRDFHDAVLRENSIPVELIRASLTGQALTRDFGPAWAFYGPVEAPDVDPKDAK